MIPTIRGIGSINSRTHVPPKLRRGEEPRRKREEVDAASVGILRSSEPNSSQSVAYRNPYEHYLPDRIRDRRTCAIIASWISYRLSFQGEMGKDRTGNNQSRHRDNKRYAPAGVVGRRVRTHFRVVGSCRGPLKGRRDVHDRILHEVDALMVDKLRLGDGVRVKKSRHMLPGKIAVLKGFQGRYLVRYDEEANDTSGL